MANNLPHTPENECSWQVLTQAANHLLPPTHPNDNIYHHINSRRDTRASTDGSHTCRHKEELRHREEYKRNHGISQRLDVYRANSITVSTNSPRLCRSARDRLKDPCRPSPPQDHYCDHAHNDHPKALGVFRVLTFTPQPWAVQWLPNFKVSNGQARPRSLLTIYSTVAHTTGASKDVMAVYLPSY